VSWGGFKVDHDDERPDDYEVAAEFGEYVLRAHVKAVKGRPVVVGLGAGRPSSGRNPKPVSLRDFRRLPVATFEAKARASVAESIRHERGELVTLADFNAAIEQARPKGRRRNGGTGTQDWARIAKAYQELVARGEPYPAAVLAKRLGVPASNVRVWIHRLRRDGVLPKEGASP
jgi:hypothetical protein